LSLSLIFCSIFTSCLIGPKASNAIAFVCLFRLDLPRAVWNARRMAQRSYNPQKAPLGSNGRNNAARRLAGAMPVRTLHVWSRWRRVTCEAGVREGRTRSGRDADVRAIATSGRYLEAVCFIPRAHNANGIPHSFARCVRTRVPPDACRRSTAPPN